MSTATTMEPFDAPMLDFSDDNDISMGGTAENWFASHSHSRMEEDGQVTMQDFSGFEYTAPTESLEVEMTPFDETAEYEMSDEVTGALAAEAIAAATDDVPISSPMPIIHSDPVEPEVTSVQETLDIEVPPVLAEVPHSEVQAPVDPTATIPPISLNAQTYTSSDIPAVEAEIAPAELPLEPVSLPLPQDHALPAVEQGTAEDVVNHIPDPSLGVAESSAADHDQIAEVQHEVHANPSVTHDASGLPAGEEQSTHIRGSEDRHDGVGLPHRGHNPVEVSEAQEPVLAQDAENTAITEAHADGGQVALPDTADESAYPESVPAVLLSLRLNALEGDQPEFALFSAPGEPTSDDVLVLLQHRPNLYYEPIAALFDALRQEEYFSHLEELIEAEMALNAYDLQLVISEDNVYAREVSLHDLTAMHESFGLTGSLRVALQSVVPRFITRYNFLREQITRLTISGEAPEAQQPELTSQVHETDTVQDKGAGDSSDQIEHAEPAEPDQGNDDGENAEAIEHPNPEDIPLPEGEDAEDDTEESQDDPQQASTIPAEDSEEHAREQPVADEAEPEDVETGVDEAAEDRIEQVQLDPTIDGGLDQADHQSEENEPSEEDLVEPDDNEHSPESESYDDEEDAEGEDDTEYHEIEEPGGDGEAGYGEEFDESGGDGTGTNYIPEEDTLDGTEAGDDLIANEAEDGLAQEEEEEGDNQEQEQDLEQRPDPSANEFSDLPPELPAETEDDAEPAVEDALPDRNTDQYSYDEFEDQEEGDGEQGEAALYEAASQEEDIGELNGEDNGAENGVVDGDVGTDDSIWLDLQVLDELACQSAHETSSAQDRSEATHADDAFPLAAVSEKVPVVTSDSTPQSKLRKRRSDDADLDEVQEISPPSSPDSKRPRVR